MPSINGKNYSAASNLILKDGAIPLTWWSSTPNFGDLLSPYLVEKISGLPVSLVHLKPAPNKKVLMKYFLKEPFSYFAIGSILRRINNRSVVWGSGTFGTETKNDFSVGATFKAVRGPLTRNLLRIYGMDCPEVYGDPALLLPTVFHPETKKKYKVGIVLRWSETEWLNRKFGDDIKKIDMNSSDIEGTLTDMLSCEKIVSSSLHGIILADAYHIPSAWLASTTPKGLEHKFFDYFLSVNKVQRPQIIDFNRDIINGEYIERCIKFDERIIEFDADKLMAACPFVDQA